MLIVGTGAMACLFAARLAASGVPVTMLGSWPEGLQALRERGVRLREPDGREINCAVNATDRPSAVQGEKYALVLVKSWQTYRVAGQLAECLSAEGLALTLQNGLGNREILTEALGAERVALGVTTTGSTLLEAGLARAVGDGSVTLSAHPRLSPLVALLTSAGFRIEIVADTSGLQWGKLVINAAINPLTALLRVPNGELLHRPTARTLMGLAAREAAQVAAARGERLPFLDPVEAAESVALRTAENYSSMLRDVQRGAPTEIDAISGAIIRAGAEEEIPTPVNRTLWQLVKAIESNGKMPDGASPLP